MVVSLLLLVLLPCAAVSSKEAAPTNDISVNLQLPLEEFPHYWEESVGSGHMLLSTRQDYREHLALCQRDLGFRAMRGHGILNDDMSTSLGPGVNSYVNVNSLMDFLLSIGMRPIVELSFMPDWLASRSMFEGGSTICHYKGNVNPPKDYDLWGEVVGSLAQQLVNRYGLDEVAQWRFEVWNEPGTYQGPGSFWNGTMAEYFKLYQSAALAIKRVSPRLQVGGPATDCCPCWITEFQQFCHANGVPFDFVSTHCYPGGDTNVGDDDKVLSDVQQARALLDTNGSRVVPFVVTEWSSTYSGGNSVAGSYHDGVAQAAMIVATTAKIAGLADVFSYWAFSDVFEEGGMPSYNISFHGGFGLLNIDGVPKPTYRAYQLLHQLGHLRAKANVTFVGGPATCASTLGVLATTDGTSAGNATNAQLLLYNHAKLGAPISDCTATVTLVPPSGKTPTAPATVRRVDETHANAFGHWIRNMQAFPGYATKAQIAELNQASQLQDEPINVEDRSGGEAATAATFTVTVPAHGLAFVSVPLR